MSTTQTLVLGAIAGLTIYVGLPIGRLRTRSFTTKTFLNGLAGGVLLFLLFEIFKHAGEEVEHALEESVEGAAAWGPFIGLAAIYVIGFGIGLFSLVYLVKTKKRTDISLGPGAMAAAEPLVVRSEALRLGMTIAAAIGLHNFSEGLAIGQSAKSGEVSLALLLIVGFALHNMTEGFGIVGPLAAADIRAPWPWLLLAGIVGGGPTFLGTIVGSSFSSVYLFVAFLALAAGAIVYVLGELFAVGRRMSWAAMLWGIFGGFILAFGTELVLEIAGG